MRSIRANSLAALLVLCSLSMIAPPMDFVQTTELEERQIDAIYDLVSSQQKALDELLPNARLSARASGTGVEWQWAASSGGSSNRTYDGNEGRGIAIDSSGNAYVTGYLRDTATFGSTVLTCFGDWCIFVAKMNSNGSWQWAVKAAATASGMGHAIAVDSSDDVYVTGSFSGTAEFGDNTLVWKGKGDSTAIPPPPDLFVAKLNNTGSWQWATGLGSTGNDHGRDIAIDSADNVYVTGAIGGEVKDEDGVTPLLGHAGYQDLFIGKLNNSGSWQWVTRAGGTGTDTGDGIAIDSNDDVYITGNFDNTLRYYENNQQHHVNSSGSSDIFIAKMNSSGSWQWVIGSGGSGQDKGLGIVIDSTDNIWVTGFFHGTAVFGSMNISASGDYDVFFARLNSSGAWQAVGRAGGATTVLGTNIAVDSSDGIYLTGYFEDTATFGNTLLTTNGGFDLFITKLTASGGLQWAVKAGGLSTDYGHAVAVDSTGNVYVTGYFGNTAAFGGINVIGTQDSNTYVAKLSPDSDGDGIGDGDDMCEGHDDSIDVDNDGIVDGCDPLIDSDGDGIGDDSDSFPNNESEWADSDGDGVGDNSDAFPDDGDETIDSDGDGVGDNSDEFPNDGNETIDSDGDGVGDNSDAFPDDSNESSDLDGDGVGDNSDVFPNDGNETIDSDGDGVGDNSDFDDDGDSWADIREIECGYDPLDFGSTPLDFDSDNECDELDPDDDNDGLLDHEDPYPQGIPPTENGSLRVNNSVDNSTANQTVDNASSTPVIPGMEGGATGSISSGDGGESTPASGLIAVVSSLICAVIIATRRSEDSQTSHPSRPDNGS